MGYLNCYKNGDGSNMNHNRKWFYMIESVLAALIFVLGIQMFFEKNATDHPRISVIIPDSENHQWSAFRYGLKMAAQDTGTELLIISTGKDLTAGEELDLISQEIEKETKAIILQPVPGANIDQKLKQLAKKIPIMLVKNTISKDPSSTSLPVVEPDHEAMGKALAEQLLQDYNGNLAGKTIGILQNEAKSQALASCKKGFEDTLKHTEAVICWTASPSLPETEKNSLKNQKKTDLVIALDNTSLTTAAEYAAANNLHGALVYGIGNSTEAIYFLDNSTIECLVVPDEFSIGYQSLREAAQNHGKRFRRMQCSHVTYYVLRRETLFSEKNQEILFTMSQ